MCEALKITHAISEANSVAAWLCQAITVASATEVRKHLHNLYYICM